MVFIWVPAKTQENERKSCFWNFSCLLWDHKRLINIKNWCKIVLCWWRFIPHYVELWYFGCLGCFMFVYLFDCLAGYLFWSGIDLEVWLAEVGWLDATVKYWILLGLSTWFIWGCMFFCYLYGKKDHRCKDSMKFLPLIVVNCCELVGICIDLEYCKWIE